MHFYYSDNDYTSRGGLKLESMTFVLFGATGDLAKRKIYPALYNLYQRSKASKANIRYWAWKT